MSEYYMGLFIGVGIGYCLALVTLLTVWTLCVIAKKVNEGR